MYVISSEKLPVKMWLDNIEEGALKQALNLANLPFAHHHIAIMPDSHEGYGMPIGGVLAAKDVIIPNAVGVDIGCGMSAVRTNLTGLTQEQIKIIFGGTKEYHGGIRSYIPVGFSHNSKKQDESLMPEGYDISKMPVVEREYNSALKQIGTLGGGNHFIEIQQSTNDDHIWIMLHSGSRNIGLQVAEYYNNLAIELNAKWFSSVPKKWDLAFLPLNSDEGQAYVREMNYCVDFAFASRKLMMDKIKNIFMNLDVDGPIYFDDMINIAHNYADVETHFHEEVVVHRKGATLATEDTIGIIPGSQGTKSYIVKGKGNPDSFMSCSHGAGRKMSRTKAQENLNLAEEQKRLDDMGILHAMRHKKDLDEAPSAYKDIDEVMENQKDLVEIMVELKPLAVIKG